MNCSFCENDIVNPFFTTFDGMNCCEGCYNALMREGRLVECPMCKAISYRGNTNGGYCFFCSYLKNSNFQENISRPKFEKIETQSIQNNLKLKVFLEDFYNKKIDMQIPINEESFELYIDNIAPDTSNVLSNIKDLIQAVRYDTDINYSDIDKTISMLEYIAKGVEHIKENIIVEDGKTKEYKEEKAVQIFKDFCSVYGSAKGMLDAANTLKNAKEKFGARISSITVVDNIPMCKIQDKFVSPVRYIMNLLSAYKAIIKNSLTSELAEKYYTFAKYYRNDTEKLKDFEKLVQDRTVKITKMIDEIKNSSGVKIRVVVSNRISDKIACQRFTEVLGTCQKKDNARSYATSVADMFSNEDIFVALFYNDSKIIARTMVRRFWHKNTGDLQYYMPDRLFSHGSFANVKVQLYNEFLQAWYKMKPDNHKILLTSYSRHSSLTNGSVFNSYTPTNLMKLSVSAKEFVKPTNSYFLQDNFHSRARPRNYGVGYYHDSGSKTVFWKDKHLVDIFPISNCFVL